MFALPKVIAGFSILSRIRGKASDPQELRAGPHWPPTCVSLASGVLSAVTAVFPSACLGCLGRVRIPVPENPWLHGLRKGRRELFKVHPQNSLGGVPVLSFSSLLFHWQVASPVWFSLEAFLGMQLPRETPVKASHKRVSLRVLRAELRL